MMKKVAPHDGCVDWNKPISNVPVGLNAVAPHDGCVDWNPNDYYPYNEGTLSHPTMGAWIEMLKEVATEWQN